MRVERLCAPITPLHDGGFYVRARRFYTRTFYCTLTQREISTKARYHARAPPVPSRIKNRTNELPEKRRLANPARGKFQSIRRLQSLFLFSKARNRGKRVKESRWKNILHGSARWTELRFLKREMGDERR